MTEDTVYVPPATASQEAAAGFSPYHEPPKKDEFGATGDDRVYDDPDTKKNIEGYARERDARDAANGSGDQTVEIFYQDGKGNRADPNLSVSEAQFGEDYDAYKKGQREAVQAQTDQDLATKVDAARRTSPGLSP